MSNKKMRYTQENQKNGVEDSSLQKTSKFQNSIGRSRMDFNIYQVKSNSSTALKDLKRVNDLSQMMKGRLSVLQIHEEKNQFKAHKSEQKYQFHQQMREYLSKDRQQKALHLKNILNKIQQTQELAKLNRRIHEQNIKKAQDQLNTSRSNDYRMTKEQKQQIEQSLSDLRRMERQKNRQRKRDITEYEKLQRQSVIDYTKNKNLQVKINDSLQSQKINKVKLEKAKQIEGLSKLQEMMIERQSRSRMSSQASQIKLKKLLTNGKAVSTSHTTKLPLIGQGKTESNQQDILII